VREWLLWCLPALLVGVLLRGVLTAQLPYAIYHDDSGDLLTTPQILLTQHHWEIHAKKTYLVPTFYTVLALCKIPILLAVPLIQHLLGLLLILMVGGLVRLWFAWWRWFIIPVTLIVAVDPYVLWYEHLLMAESPMLFCTVLVGVAGTLYALRQSLERFIFLCCSLVLAAGARPEGKLFFAFAVFLALLVHASRIRTDWRRLAILLVLGVAMHLVTKTAQAGLLLYTSVARLTPSNLKCAPDFEPYIAPIRAKLQERWDRELAMPKVADRRLIAGAVEDYLKTHKSLAHQALKRGANDFCLRIASETCRRNFFKLPYYAYQKFRSTMREAPAGLLDAEWIFERQPASYAGNQRVTFGDAEGRGISREITGREMTDEADYDAFLREKYREIPWFNSFSGAWSKAMNSVRFPDELRPSGARTLRIPRLPVYFVAAGAGVILMLFRRGPLQRFHIAWGLYLIGFFYVIILTANVRARFRFAFEPFWFIYIFLILDCLAFWILTRGSSRAEVVRDGESAVAAA